MSDAEGSVSEFIKDKPKQGLYDGPDLKELYSKQQDPHGQPDRPQALFDSGERGFQHNTNVQCSELR